MVIIRQAKVSAKGELKSGEIGLVLKQLADGWTYRVEEVSGEPFFLTWRSRTPEQASRKLMDVYNPNNWELRIVDGDGADPPSRRSAEF